MLRTLSKSPIKQIFSGPSALAASGGPRLAVQAAIPVRPRRGNQRAAPVGQNHKKLRNTPSCEAPDDKEPPPFKYMPFTSDDDRIRIFLVTGSLSCLRSIASTGSCSSRRSVNIRIAHGYSLYVERWLKAPVQMEAGSIVPRTAGTPQGGVISPLLANLFLHYAFDTWMARGLSAHSVRALCGRRHLSLPKRRRGAGAVERA